MSKCLNKKGQAKVEIIIPNPVIFKSIPLLPLSVQRKNRCSEYNKFNERHLFFTEYSGAGLKCHWIRNNNFNFSLSLSHLFVPLFLFCFSMVPYCHKMERKYFPQIFQNRKGEKLHIFGQLDYSYHIKQ